MDRRRLGASPLSVSRLSLGSWRTFERIGRDDGVAVMRTAREHGLNFLDDARYDDELGTAPLPTGYSEVLFGELFRAAGWDRDDTETSCGGSSGPSRTLRRSSTPRLTGWVLTTST